MQQWRREPHYLILCAALLATVLFLFGPPEAAAAAATTESSSEKSTDGDDVGNLLEYCRSVGFDPWQLSCETCGILPDKDNIQKNCQQCCQSYKTSERMTKPYESAVLVHRLQSSPAAGGGDDSEMEQFLKEHWDDLVKAKGAKRLKKIVRDDSASSVRYMLMRPPSEMLLWFDKIVEPGKPLKEYKEQATEIIYLYGYKKDDMKDMVSTLLPDSK